MNENMEKEFLPRLIIAMLGGAIIGSIASSMVVTLLGCFVWSVVCIIAPNPLKYLK